MGSSFHLLSNWTHFFACINTDTGIYLMRVDVVNNKVLSNASLDQAAPIAFAWDYTTAILYEDTRVPMTHLHSLFAVNYTNGNQISEIYYFHGQGYIGILDVDTGFYYEGQEVYNQSNNVFTTNIIAVNVNSQVAQTPMLLDLYADDFAIYVP